MNKEELGLKITEILKKKVRYKKSETMVLDYGIASEEIPLIVDGISDLVNKLNKEK